MKTPQFSILIPYHNSQATIAETLASVMAQKVDSFEVIIADDRSTAEARAVIAKLSAPDTRIRIVNAARPGPSSARNTAAAAAHGEILCFLDADDCLHPDALSAYSQAFAENPCLGIAFGRVRITPEPKQPGGVVTPYCPSPSFAQIAGENRVCTASNITVRKKAFDDIGGFNENLVHAEDQEWLARAFVNANWRMRGLDQVTLDYRTSPGGLSSDLKRMEQGWLQMMRAFRESAPSTARGQIATARGMFYRYLARRALRLGQSRLDSILYMAHALIAHPAIIFSETRRTLPTLAASVAVLLFGARPFRNILH